MDHRAVYWIEWAPGLAKACDTLFNQNSHFLLISFSSLWCIPFCSRTVGWWPALTSVHQLCKAFLSCHSSVCFCVCFISSVPQYCHNMPQYAFRNITLEHVVVFFTQNKRKWWEPTWLSLMSHVTPPPFPHPTPFSFSLCWTMESVLWCVLRQAVHHWNLYYFSIVRNAEGGPGLRAFMKTHLLAC